MLFFYILSKHSLDKILNPWGKVLDLNFDKIWGSRTYKKYSSKRSALCSSDHILVMLYRALKTNWNFIDTLISISYSGLSHNLSRFSLVKVQLEKAGQFPLQSFQDYFIYHAKMSILYWSLKSFANTSSLVKFVLHFQSLCRYLFTSFVFLLHLYFTLFIYD